MAFTANGRVSQVQGSVVDVEFPQSELPDIYEAVEVIRPGLPPLLLEVQKHMGENQIRCVAMDSTDGLQRNLPARRTGNPIMVPVGPHTLGRVFNVLGVPIDNGGSGGLGPVLSDPPPCSEICRTIHPGRSV